MRAGNRMDPEGFSNAFKWVRTGNHGWILSLKIVIPSADFQGLLSPFAQWPRISANQSWSLAPHRSDLMGHQGSTAQVGPDLVSPTGRVIDHDPRRIWREKA
jgi:hypothetical protein